MKRGLAQRAILVGLPGMQPIPETKSKTRKKIPIPSPQILPEPPELNHRKPVHREL